MDIELVKGEINRIHPLTAEAWKDFSELFKPVEVSKGGYIIQEGEMAQHCFLLVEGIVRVYYNKEGNEYNKTFFTPGMFPTPLTALLSSSPSQLTFQALTSCHLIKFSFQEFRKLFEQHRCLETFFLRILEHVWIKKERHDIRMVTNDATTNYLIFREEYPNLENQIPQYHIASYLGITPIQLSRIRAQLANA